jgi:hypothetical protein
MVMMTTVIRIVMVVKGVMMIVIVWHWIQF